MQRRLDSGDVSLNADINDGEGRPLTRMDLLVDGGDLSDVLVEEAHFSDEFGEQLETFAKPLTDKEDYIFRNRLIVEDPMTLREIGDRFGVSRERVRQIEKRLLGKLRTYLEAEMPEYFGDKD